MKKIKRSKRYLLFYLLYFSEIFFFTQFPEKTYAINEHANYTQSGQYLLDKKYEKELNEVYIIETENLQLHFHLNSGYISNVEVPGSKLVSESVGGIYFIDGDSGEFIFPNKVVIDSVEDRRISYRILGLPDGTGAFAQISWSNTVVHWVVEIANHSNQARFLEVRLGLPVMVSETMKYWDGYDGMAYGYPDSNGKIIQPRMRQVTQYANMISHAANPARMRPNTDLPKITMANHEPAMLGVFPVNLLFDRDSGIALGADPNFLMSYYAGGVQPRFTSHENFYYALKYVVHPGQKEKQGFVLYSFQPDGFGYRPALKEYYDAFPEKFRRRKSLNPLALKVGSGINKGKMDINELWAEYSRRHQLGYVWFYTGHLKTGEYWPSNEKNYLKELKKFIQRAQKGCMIGYYTNPQRCEIRLAEEKFADSLVRTIDGAPKIKGRVLKDETLVTMFPWVNRYGEHLKKDLAQIVEKGGAQAIAFDNAHASEFYFGPALSDLNGAAFTVPNNKNEPFAKLSNSSGPSPLAYAPTYIGYAYLMDFLRERFKSLGKETAFIGNNAWALATAIRCDAGYLEWHWKPPLKRVGIFQALRYLMGGKRPISYKIAGRLKGNQIQISPGERNKILHERKFSLLHLFRYGGYPVMRKKMGAGDPDCLAALPILVKLCRAGWEPVSGIRHDKDLWVERFGDEGLNYISVINHTSKAYNGSLKADNAYLGPGYRWFAPLFGHQAAVICRSQMGKTEIDVSIPATSVQVMQTPLQIICMDKNTTLEGKLKYSSEKMIISIKVDKPCSIELIAFLPDGAYDARVMIKDDKRLESSLTNDMLRVLVPEEVLEKTADIIINWRNLFHLINKQEILAFPYLQDKKPACEIVAQDGYFEIAKRLQLYFIYWQLQKEFSIWLQQKGTTPPPDINEVEKIPIVPLPKKVDSNTIYIGDIDFVRQNAAIQTSEFPLNFVLSTQKSYAATFSSIDKKVLLLTFPNSKKAKENLELFFDTLDEAFSTSPGYDANYGRHRSMNEIGSIYKPYPEQPNMGWYQFLEYLVN